MRLYALALGLSLLSSAVIAAPKSGIESANFDRSVRIQDNLYQAVNGNWQKKTEIPSDLTWWGAFAELRDLSEYRVKGIAEQAVVNAKTNLETNKIADLYSSFMDVEGVEGVGMTPLKPLLEEVASVSNVKALSQEFGRLQRLGVSLPVNISVGVDAGDSAHYLLNISQSGLGLPDRDYYLQKDKRMVDARTAYITYLRTLFTLLGDTQSVAKKKAEALLGFETKLAKLQWTQVENRDPVRTYNKLDMVSLATAAPGYDWTAFLNAAGHAVSEVNLNQPSYARAAVKLFGTTGASLWHDYLIARIVDRYSPVLSQAFVNAHFRFHAQALAGAKELKPRWKRGVALLEDNLGEQIGKEYIDKYFPASAKERMDALVSNLMKTYALSIDTLSWMSPVTKEQAKAKLSKYAVKIGYPDKWRDYSKLNIEPGDLFGNFTRGAEFAYEFDMSHLGKPVDRTEWGMTPQTVNAYYDPSKNEIVFPAAILQPPFFNAEADDAVNYGGIGAVIGHEISHGFDDQGSQFDGDGNLRVWWLDKDKKAFTGLTSRLVTQYNAYSPIKGRYINGKLTLGENIADLSGLQIAFKAYHLSLGTTEAPVIDAYSGDQRFFIGFAQIWREKDREETALQWLVTDPHSPSEFRTVGAVMNSDAFHTAFDIKPGDKMFKSKDDRIHIW